MTSARPETMKLTITQRRRKSQDHARDLTQEKLELMGEEIVVVLPQDMMGTKSAKKRFKRNIERHKCRILDSIEKQDKTSKILLSDFPQL